MNTALEKIDYLTLEHKDRVYKKGESIGIRGLKGPFVFQYWELSPVNGKVIVHVWEHNFCFRAFYIEKVKPPKKKKKSGFCHDHPGYGAVRKPRTDCIVCWHAYDLAQARNEDIDKKLLTIELVEE